MVRASPPTTRSCSIRSAVPLWVAVTAIMLLAGGLRFYQLAELPLWLDESSTWAEVQKPYGAIEKDVHPPLYYYLQRAWLYGAPQWGLPGLAPDDREFWLRAPSVLAAALTVPLIVLTGRLLGGVSVGLLAALLFAVAPFQVRYGQEAKAYALLTLAAVLAMWAVAELVSRYRAGRDSEAPQCCGGWILWLAYGAGVCAALYCHNTGLFVPAAANAVVLAALATGKLDRSVLRPWLIAQGVVLLAWAPWLPTLLAQSQALASGYWIPEPGVAEVIYSFRELLWNAELLLPADLLVLGLAGWGMWSWRNRPASLVLTVGFIAIPVVGELIVSLVQPVFLIRTLIWTAVPLYVLVARGALSLPHRLASSAAVVAMLACNLLGLGAYYADFEKEAWEEAVAYSVEQLEAGPVEAILIDRGFVRTAFEYYFRHYDYDVPIVALDQPERFTDQIAEAGPGRVLLIYSHTDGDTTSADILESRGPMIAGQSFFGVVVLVHEIH